MKFEAHQIIKTDHLGNEYKSMNEMLKHYGITYVPFMYRLQILHMSLEDALTCPPQSNLSTAIKCKDHLGNSFESKAAMCDYWKIPRATYFRRIRNGWSQEKALSTPLNGRLSHKSQARFVKDHKGKTYSCIEKMCEAYDISKKQYIMNIRNNCSIEEALTTVTTQTAPKDHLGNEYHSINEMCRAYGIAKDTLRSRLELGWTLREVLEQPQKRHPEKKSVDHLGNEYTSVNEMLAHYGVSHIKYKERLKRGYSLEDALAAEKNFSRDQCTDHMGNIFARKIDMAIYWNTKWSLIWSKLKRGVTLEDALSNIMRRKNKNYGPGLTIIKNVNGDFYEVKLFENEMVWHVNEIFDYYRRTCLPNEGKDLLLDPNNSKGT